MTPDAHSGLASDTEPCLLASESLRYCWSVVFVCVRVQVDFQLLLCKCFVPINDDFYVLYVWTFVCGLIDQILRGFL